MKLKFNSTLSLFLITTIWVIIMTSCNNKKETNESTYIATSLETTSLCESDWFPHSQTPAPEEGKGSPFDTSSTTNSIFHQWSWQKFLWLTKPSGTDHVLFQDSLTLVTNYLIPVAPVDKIDLVLSDIDQAGSNGVLMSNAAFNGQTDTIYYGIYANDILLKAANSFKKIMLTDPPNLNNDYVFPVGSLEVKTAWVEASSIPSGQLSSYFTTNAYITSKSKSTTVALLGVHVVGVVINHPEFIWATFEHNAMAGYYDWTDTTADNDVPVTVDESVLFFAKGDTATIDNIQYDTITTPYTTENVFTVFQFGIPRTVGNVIMPNLSQDSTTNISNYDNIVSLNECVSAELTDVWKNYFYNGSIWVNTDGLTPSQQVTMLKKHGNHVGSTKKDSVARGALAAFNITMETFAQTFGQKNIHSMTSSNLTNCISCHTATAGIVIGNDTINSSSTLYFSHIFRSYLSFNSGVSEDDLKKIRTKELLDMLVEQGKTKKE